MSRDVFEEDPSQPGSELSRDPGDIGPEVPLVLGASPLTCGAEWLTGVSGKDRVEGSGEGPGVEGREIVPDGGGGEVSRALRGNEDGSRVFLPLDKASGVEPGFREHEAHIKSTAACAEGEAVSGPGR